jgi:hypothetical protein
VPLIEAPPTGYIEHGSFRMPDPQKPGRPHPVVAGGRRGLRPQDHLYAYDVRGPGADSGTR